MSDALSLWTVFDKPRDYPDKYVARRSEVDRHATPRNTSDVILADSLEALRALLLRRGLYCIPRYQGDEPHIIEVWL